MAIKFGPMHKTSRPSGGIGSIIAKYESAAAQAAAANIAREGEVRGLYGEIIKRYGPGGTFGAGEEAKLGVEKTKAVGAGTQQLISSGLYGTEAGSGLEKAWEAEVGVPARLQLADIKAERLSQAQQSYAGFLTGISDEYPDYGSLMSYAAQAANVPTGGGGSYRGAQGDLPSQQMWTEEKTTIPSSSSYDGGTSYGGYGGATTGGYGTTTAPITSSYGGTYGGYADVINKILGKVTIPKKTATKKTTTGYGEFAGGGGGTFGGYGASGSW